MKPFLDTQNGLDQATSELRKILYDPTEKNHPHLKENLVKGKNRKKISKKWSGNKVYVYSQNQ